jgi:hypothetical protein
MKKTGLFEIFFLKNTSKNPAFQKFLYFTSNLLNPFLGKLSKKIILIKPTTVGIISRLSSTYAIQILLDIYSSDDFEGIG